MFWAVLWSRSNFDRLRVQVWRPAPVPAQAPGTKNLLHKFKERNSVLKNKRSNCTGTFLTVCIFFLSICVTIVIIRLNTTLVLGDIVV